MDRKVRDAVGMGKPFETFVVCSILIATVLTQHSCIGRDCGPYWTTSKEDGYYTSMPDIVATVESLHHSGGWQLNPTVSLEKSDRTYLEIRLENDDCLGGLWLRGLMESGQYRIRDMDYQGLCEQTGDDLMYYSVWVTGKDVDCPVSVEYAEDLSEVTLVFDQCVIEVTRLNLFEGDPDELGLTRIEFNGTQRLPLTESATACR